MVCTPIILSHQIERRVVYFLAADCTTYTNSAFTCLDYRDFLLTFDLPCEVLTQIVVSVGRKEPHSKWEPRKFIPIF